MTGVIAVVVGLAVGFGIGKMTMTETSSTNTNTSTDTSASRAQAVAEGRAQGESTASKKTDTKAANLRVVLNALEREHVDLASIATRNGFDGRSDFAASAAALDKNSKELAAAVGSIYGAEAEKKFYDIWNSHIGFFVDYTVAAKAGDQAKMDKAVQNLGGYIDAISDFFSGANPNLPRQAVHQLVTSHVGLLKGAVDAYGGKDFNKSYDQQRAASQQIGQIADAISGAIVKQYPEKF